MKKATIMLVVVLMLLMTSVSVFGLSDDYTGFYETVVGYRYYENGKYVTGWKEIDGATYYFYKSNGYMVTENRFIGGEFCAFDESGVYIGNTGFYVDDEGTMYYEDGKRVTGWKEIDGETYYFYKASGYMVTESRYVGGVWCVFDSEGHLITPEGFITDENGTRYYADNKYVTGWQEIDGETYYFIKSDGYMVTESRYIGGIWTAFNADGTLNKINGFVEENGNTRYYVDGKAATGWQDIDGETYYFYQATGYMVTESRTVGGVWYNFNADGTLVKESNPAEDETAAIEEALAASEIWTNAAYTKKYADNESLTGAAIAADFASALGVDYTVSVADDVCAALASSFNAAASDTSVTDTVAVTVSGAEGGSVSADIAFTITKVGASITVSEVTNITQCVGTPVSGNGNHGGHQTRILRTSHGTYMAYINRDSLTGGWLGHEEFVCIRVDGENTEIIYRDYTPYDSIYVLADENEDVYFVTGTSTTRYDPYSPEYAQTTIWKYYRDTGLIQGYTTRMPFETGFSYGYMAAVLDTERDCIYTTYCGGGGVEPGWYAWHIFDLNTLTFRDHVGIRDVGSTVGGVSNRHCYSYLFPDGEGGIRILGQRDVVGSAVGYDSSTYTFDQLNLFVIDDLWSDDQTAITQLTVHHGTSKNGILPTVQNNTQGDTYMDNNGRIHVLYTTHNDSGRLNEVVARHHVINKDNTNAYVRKKQVIHDSSYVAGTTYSARMLQDSNGLYYIFYLQYDLKPILKIYTSTNGTTGYTLKETIDLGFRDDQVVTYCGILISNRRNNSLQDDVVEVLIPIEGETMKTPEGSYGTDYYHVTVDLFGYDLD